jgi:flagellar FliJ protein
VKAYSFRFDSVLKSKRIIVDQLAAKTARAQRILMLEMRTLEDLEARGELCMRELALLQTGNVEAAEVSRSHRYLHLLAGAIKEQKHKVAEVARRVDMLRDMLIAAEKERKIFEKLDEKEREEFHRGYLKKEQAVLDEVGTSRFIQRESHRQTHTSAPG